VLHLPVESANPLKIKESQFQSLVILKLVLEKRLTIAFSFKYTVTLSKLKF
jgi:hypothetical protein